MPLSEQDIQLLTEKFGKELVDQEIIGATEQLSKALDALGLDFKDYAVQTDTAEVEKQAVEQIETDLKSFIPTVIKDMAELAQWTVAIGRAHKAEKDAFDARVEDMNAKLDGALATVAALKEQHDGIPRSASSAEATELTKERIEAIVTQADKQNTIKDSFWEFPGHANGA